MRGDGEGKTGAGACRERGTGRQWEICMYTYGDGERERTSWAITIVRQFERGMDVNEEGGVQESGKRSMSRERERGTGRQTEI